MYPLNLFIFLPRWKLGQWPGLDVLAVWLGSGQAHGNCDHMCGARWLTGPWGGGDAQLPGGRAPGRASGLWASVRTAWLWAPTLASLTRSLLIGKMKADFKMMGV